MRRPNMMRNSGSRGRRGVGSLFLAIALNVAGYVPLVAQSGGSYQITNSVVGGGGGESKDVANNRFVHESTIGEHAAGALLIKTPYSQTAGLGASLVGFTSPTGNLLDTTDFFVRQHYLDFLGREPDSSGLAFWIDNIDSCAADANCRADKRIETSAAFFLSIEFQQTGFLVERIYQSAFNRFPSFIELISSTQEIAREVVVGQTGWEARLEANKGAFVADFTARPDFVAVYSGLSNEQYVDALNVNTGNSLSTSDRNELVAELNGAIETRATVVRKVAENAEFTRRQFNRAFVLMQYYGYLRRNPNDPPDADFSGYNFWLTKLNSFAGDFRRAEMVKAFITSGEYRQRFGQP